MDHDVLEALREASSEHDDAGFDLDQVVARGRARRRRRAWAKAGSAAVATAAVITIAVGVTQHGTLPGATHDGDRVSATHSAAPSPTTSPTPSKQQVGRWSGVDWGACTREESNKKDLISQGIMPYWLHLRDAVDPSADHLACTGSMGGTPQDGMHFGGYYTVGHRTSEVLAAVFDKDADGGTYAETYLPLPCGTNSTVRYGDLTCATVPDPAGGHLVYGQRNGPHGPTRVASYRAPDGMTVVFMYSPDVDFSNLNAATPMTTTPVTRAQALAIVTDPFYRDGSGSAVAGTR